MSTYKSTEDWLFYIGHGLLVILLIGWPLYLHFAPGLSLRCLFNEMTGYVCPACGGTRAFNAMIHGHLIQSVKLNAVVVYFFLLYGYFMISWYIQKISKNKFRVGMPYRNVYVYGGLVLLFLQCTIKNMLIYLGT